MVGLDYIVQNMTPLVTWMSLIWFILGLLIGKRIQAGRVTGAPSKAKPSAKGKPVELYIGNLPFSTTEKELQQLFGKHGPVRSIRIIENAINGKSKGYGFVLMGDKASADAAMQGIGGSKMSGREVVVNLAKSKQDW
ncbi:MAG: RNA-binding protein [Verrucomicrobia bacterium]|nr:RNA-binding protein [Verrucomicrobiota bacterium]MDA1088141.1 RNA-binding protein [Verrucomicrobiota bacterium]